MSQKNDAIDTLLYNIEMMFAQMPTENYKGQIFEDAVGASLATIEVDEGTYTDSEWEEAERVWEDVICDIDTEIIDVLKDNIRPLIEDLITRKTEQVRDNMSYRVVDSKKIKASRL